MLRLIRHFIVVIALFLPLSTWATEYLDSLKNIALGKIDASSENRVQAMLELSRFSWASDPDSSIALVNLALDIAEDINNPSLMGDAWFDLGMIAYINGSSVNAFDYFVEASNAFEQTNEIFKQGNSYYQVALCLKEQGYFQKAVSWLEKVRQVLPENESHQLAYSVANEMGYCYLSVGDTANAEKSYLDALSIAINQEDTTSVISSHIELGVFYNSIEQYNHAIVEFNGAIKLIKPSQKQLLAQLYNQLGETYLLKNNLDDALNNFNMALGLANESKSIVAQAKTHFNLSKLYEMQQKFALALIEYKLYSSFHDTMNKLETKDISSLQAKFDNVFKDLEMKQKDLEMAKKEDEADEKLRGEAFKRNVMIGGIIVIGLFGFLLLLAFRRQKGINKKLDHLGMVAREIENTVIIADSEGNVEWLNESYRRKYGLDLEGFITKYGKNLFEHAPHEEFMEKVRIAKRDKCTVQYYISNQDKDGLQRNMKTTLTPRINKDGEITNFILIDTEITDLVLAEKQLTKERDKLAVVYNQVSESIDYAKRIQEAVLPHTNKISKFFSDYYLLYLPKDGVSGDFYFVEETDQYIYLAGADCTGHGIPGALMSVICYNLLENAIHKFSETDEILAELNNQLIRKLRQSTEDEEHIKDGLDIALVRIPKEQNHCELQFSGAHSSVYLLSGNALNELKPTRIHLGQKEITAEAIKKETILITEDTELVFFSDGYPDQKGGVDNKKFYYPPFRELIKTVNQLPQDEKLKHLNKAFNKWKLGKEQTDDVLVWGLKIKL